LPSKGKEGSKPAQLEGDKRYTNEHNALGDGSINGTWVPLLLKEP